MNERTSERNAARFWSKVNKDGPVPAARPDLGPCWLWKPVPSNGGYGQFYLNGKPRLAHRASYELFVKPIPPGLTIDHLCEVRACVRPDHLDPVTLAENLRRAKVWEGGAAAQREKTHCPQGHPYDEANTRRSGNGRRHCKACAREQMARRRERGRAENAPPPRKLKEFCPKGHSYAEFGVVRAGQRQCVLCERERCREYRARKKAANPPAPKLTCKHGHPWIAENIYTDPRGRTACRTCHNERTLAAYHARKAAGAA